MSFTSIYAPDGEKAASELFPTGSFSFARIFADVRVAIVSPSSLISGKVTKAF
jgi:hypothetical protein